MEKKDSNKNEATEKPVKSYPFMDTLFWYGIIPGIIAIAGYSLTNSCCWNFLWLSLIIASACFIVGFFIGFLFGIPKRKNNDNEQSLYTINTNLIEISDWLTKIIIGVGLVELKQITAYVLKIADFVSIKTTCDNSVSIFVICCIIYFTIFGIYYGYNYMRLFLTEQYINADNYLLKQKLEKKTDALNTAMEAAFHKANNLNVIKEKDVDEFLNKRDPSKYKILKFEQFSGLLNKAKGKLNNGKKKNPVDPQKGQWGGEAERNGKKLSATVVSLNDSMTLFKVNLKVESTTDMPLNNDDLMIFNLHDTFRTPQKIVTPMDGIAKLELVVYGSFTVGVLADDGNTELELDLAELPDVPQEFKDR